jgi:hypothetical protein
MDTFKVFTNIFNPSKLLVENGKQIVLFFLGKDRYLKNILSPRKL